MDTGRGQVLHDRAHELVDVLVAQTEPRRSGLVEKTTDRRPHLRRPPEGEQQGRLGAAEALEHDLRGRPQVEGVDDQARIPAALELDHPGEASVVACRRLQAHGDHRLVPLAPEGPEPGLGAAEIGGGHRRKSVVADCGRGVGHPGQEVRDGVGEVGHSPVRRRDPEGA